LMTVILLADCVPSAGFVCVVVFVMGLKLATAFKRSTIILPPTNAFLQFTYVNAPKNKLRLKQKRALFQREMDTTARKAYHLRSIAG